MRPRLLYVSVFLLTLLPAPVWSWGMGRGGFHSRGFHGGFGPPGWHGGRGISPSWHGGGAIFWGGPSVFVLHEQHFFVSGPTGLPPLGASGSTPGLFPPPPRVFRAPFFCVAHGVEFQMKEDFFAHLQHEHGILPERAWSLCSIVSRRQIGYFGR